MSKLTIEHYEHSMKLSFEEGGYIYATPKELALSNNWRGYIDDGNHQGILDPGRIIIVQNLGTGPGANGHDGTTIHHHWCDTLHLFKVILILRENFLSGLAKAKLLGSSEAWAFEQACRKDEVELDRLPTTRKREPRLTVMQAVLHPNARSLGVTLALFMRSLEPKWRERLMETLSDYLPRAVVTGCYDGEFYFDGRKTGLGFNGGIILRGQEFSIHT